MATLPPILQSRPPPYLDLSCPFFSVPTELFLPNPGVQYTAATGGDRKHSRKNLLPKKVALEHHLRGHRPPFTASTANV